jgi:NADH-quinone oxidoreductase subunit M
MQEWPVLSVLIGLPIVGGALLLALSRVTAIDSRWLALLVSVLALLASQPLLSGYDPTVSGMQFVENNAWIPAFNIRYFLGVDGLAVPLILLTTFSTVLVVLAGWDVIERHRAQYYAAFLIMEGLMVGVFSALDSILFYVFWEAMLIPMFLIIGIWGGARRVYATIKFFLYTFLGSVFMLVALVYMALKADSFSVLAMHDLPLNMREQTLIFLAFFAAFAVKVPMWPVHTWLPDAHVEAPTGGSVILAAVMLKIGGYGFLRFSLPIAPDASQSLDWLMITLSLVAVGYIGLVALVQEDMKKLVAYSSIAHMGFVTLGLFVIFGILKSSGDEAKAALGVQGALVQMISHGFISGALFLCVGVLYDRMHSRAIGDYGGVANTMPVFAAFAVFFAMANAGLPGTSGFVGEFMVILASFNANIWYAFVASLTLIFGAAYSLWMIKRVVFGPVANQHVAELTDVNRREFFILAVLVVAVLALGIWPDPLVHMMQGSVEHLVEQVQRSKLP